MADEPTKEELQEQARKAGLPVSGTKEEIQARLDEAGAGDNGLRGGAQPSEANAEVDRMREQAKDGGGWQGAVDPGEGREPAPPIE